jgi:hypothetical protein
VVTPSLLAAHSISGSSAQSPRRMPMTVTAGLPGA